jgi:bacteriocin-like protein
MKTLSENEMKKITGGVNWVVVSFISGALSFIVGVIDGWINPKKCNS